MGGVDARAAIAVVGDPVVDVHGARIGTLHAVMVDRGTGEAVWLVVRAGTIRATRVLAPPAGATAGNGTVWLPHAKALVTGSPGVIGGRPVSPALEHATCRHYGVEPTPGAKRHEWERRSHLAMVRTHADLDRRERLHAPEPDRREATARAGEPRRATA